jgi:hypothetical protein
VSEPVPPSVQKQAYSCPHCGAYTTQHWFSIGGASNSNNHMPFRIYDPVEALERVPKKEGAIERAKAKKWLEEMATGLPKFSDEDTTLYAKTINNLDVSKCYHCKQLAVWVGDNMVWPRSNEMPRPNPDLPDDIARDYLEAAQIVGASPRGAAALLRLCVQKLCTELGEPGKNINADIAALVQKGLNVKVQKMLDTVRVIGNDAVHPGKLDLSDNRELAEQLFRLVNMIADAMISQPKAVDEIYGKLGPDKLAAIEQRDAIKE